MNKESLEKMREEVFKIKDCKTINELDKTELLLNIDKFLQKYDINIQILNENERKLKLNGKR